MALFIECMPSCVQIVLDTADIVRDGGFIVNRERKPAATLFLTEDLGPESKATQD